MDNFINNDFLLKSNSAKILYNEYAKDVPIFDFHNHLSPKEIYENKNYETITQLWLNKDHYKWRLMRLAGINEDLITGNETDGEKFLAFSKVLQNLIGCPIYDWTHLELKRFFNINYELNEENALEVFEHCNSLLQKHDFKPRELLLKMNVRVLCTTDDPFDNLYYHHKLKEDFKEIKIVPTFRPDKIISIEKENWVLEIKRLINSEGINIDSLATLKIALSTSLNRFISLGCISSDHGLEVFDYSNDIVTDLEYVFKKAIKHDKLSLQEITAYKTNILNYLGELYHNNNISMQLHFGALRNTNLKSYAKLGVDSGYDSVGLMVSPVTILDYFNYLNNKNALPKTIMYCLNQNDYPALVTICASFSEENIYNKVQLGTAWWFNDTKRGMEIQLDYLIENGLLPGFVGMLTDSRSIASFVRHEYFRRILCNKLGEIIEDGRYNNIKQAGEIVTNICYYNAQYFFMRGEI